MKRRMHCDVLRAVALGLLALALAGCAGDANSPEKAGKRPQWAEYVPVVWSVEEDGLVRKPELLTIEHIGALIEVLNGWEPFRVESGPPCRVYISAESAANEELVWNFTSKAEGLRKSPVREWLDTSQWVPYVPVVDITGDEAVTKPHMLTAKHIGALAEVLALRGTPFWYKGGEQAQFMIPTTFGDDVRSMHQLTESAEQLRNSRLKRVGEPAAPQQ